MGTGYAAGGATDTLPHRVMAPGGGSSFRLACYSNRHHQPEDF
jgi:hypothetical protein